MQTSALALMAMFISGAVAVGYGFMQPDRLEVVLPRDAIRAIDNPQFEPAENARGWNNNELVIGMVGESEQRAYSTWQLDRHEIVNDTFEGQPIAVTW